MAHVQVRMQHCSGQVGQGCMTGACPVVMLVYIPSDIMMHLTQGLSEEMPSDVRTANRHLLTRPASTAHDRLIHLMIIVMHDKLSCSMATLHLM